MTFPRKYSWLGMLKKDGLLLKESQVVGVSRWDNDYREFILQGKLSLVRVLLRGRQPIDSQLAIHRILELSPESPTKNPFVRYALHPRLRRRMYYATILSTVLLFYVEFVGRIFDIHCKELVSWPLFFLALGIAPLLIVLSALIHCQRMQ